MGNIIPAKKRTTLAMCEKALEKSGGFISRAAQMLEITPSALTRRIQRSEKLQKLKADIEDKYLDLAESKLMSKVQKEDLGAICFYLKCKGKDRGYIEKQVIDVNNNITETKNIKELSEDEAAEIYRNFMKKNNE